MTPAFGGDRRVLAGVAAAIARLLSLDVAVVRLAIIGACLAAPPLVLVYLVVAPIAAVVIPRRPLRRLAGVNERAPAGAIGVLLAEAAVLLVLRERGLTLSDPVVVAIVAVQASVALTFRSLEGEDRLAWLAGAPTGRRLTIGPVTVGAGALRVGFGVLLALVGLDRLARLRVPWRSLRDSLSVLGPAALILGCAVLVFLPPILGLAAQVAAERRERIGAEERSKLATHLHDSVLQTLVLVQRRADDPAAITTLARRQERELREWLYGGARAAAAGRLRDRLTALAAELEDRYRWRVELVVVGDRDVGEAEETLLAATREAVVNAARHSGAPVCDVYCECTLDGVELYVRDRGRGFEPGTVGLDRRGLSESIIGRMEQLPGGAATVRSAPGSGTEISLRLDAVAPVAPVSVGDLT